jgi:cyd operon protein YbgT
MWYFTWILGVSLACGAGVLNALWHELHMPDDLLSE